MKDAAASEIVECTECHDEVEVIGALSLIREPFVCVQCLDPRHKPVEKLLEKIMS